MDRGFPQILKELRLHDKLTYKQLAAKIGYHLSMIGSWELGQAEPKMSALIALADHFGVSLDYLVGRKDY